jgi:hypothetical protein
MSQETMVLLSLLSLHATWVLLPLVPAILIYWLFPDTAVAVKGPLAKLTVRASGAFAAYLIVFVVTIPLVKDHEYTIGTFQHPFWTIKGKIKLVDKNGKELTSEDLLSAVIVQTSPKLFNVDSYFITMNVPQPKELPLIVLEIPKFGKSVIDLNDRSGVMMDDYEKIIQFKQPIEIKETAPIAGSPVKAEPIASRPLQDRGEQEEKVQSR